MNPMRTLCFFCGVIFVAFLIQCLIGCRTSHKILRYIPLYCSGISFVFMAVTSASDKDFHTIVAAMWGMIGVCLLLGYGSAILVYKIRRGFAYQNCH